MVDILSTAPGALVYHLITLFVIEAVLGMALDEWHRTHQEKHRRIIWAFASALFMRFVLMLLAFLDWQGLLKVAFFAPPLERFFDVAFVVLLCWAFLPPLASNRRISQVFLAVNLTVAVVAYIFLAPLWYSSLTQNPALYYSGYWQETFWEIWKMLLLGMACLVLLLYESEQKGILLGAFASLLVGHVLHSLLPYGPSHMAGWERLSSLVALPLFAVATYRSTIGELSARSQMLQDISNESLEQIKGLLFLFETGQKTTSSLNLEEVLGSAVRGVAQVLNADLCAIAFPEEKVPDRVYIAAVYNPYPGAQRPEGRVSFALNEQQAVKHALRRRKRVSTDSVEGSASLRELYLALGSDESGPIMVQPMVRGEKALGVIIVGNPRSKRAFSTSQGKMCQTLAEQIVVSIENARLYRRMEEKAAELEKALQAQEKKLEEHRMAVEEEVQKSKEDAELFAQKLYELDIQSKKELEELRQRLRLREAELESKARQVRELEEELNRALSQAREKEPAWQDVDTELHKSRVEAEQLSARLRLMGAELSQKQEQIHQLTEKLSRLETEAEEKARLEKEARKYQSKLQALEKELEKARLVAQPGAAEGGIAWELALLESWPGGMLISDAEGRIIAANTAAGEILGLDHKSLPGLPLEEICKNSRWRERLQSLRANFEKEGEKKSTQIDLEIGLKTMQARLAPIVLEGRWAGLLVALYDGPDARRSRDKYVASLTQELRTPMTSIVGYTDLLLGESVGLIGEMQRKFLQRIKANIERMGGMLNDLLGVIAISSGEIEIHARHLNVSEIIENTIMGARAQLEEKEINVELDLAENLPLVNADPDFLGQVMTNLLNNACKASPAGGSIGVRARVEAEYLLVSVSDSGGGIAPEDRPRVFNGFYRSESPLIAGLGETSMGLALAKALVEAHGGQIWLESEMGVGSTFSFALPLTRPD